MAGDAGRAGGERILSSAPPRESKGRWIAGALLATLVAAVVGAAAWLVVDSTRLAVAMPAQLNYLDGYMVDDASRLASGGPLYLDPANPPYSVTVYTPGAIAAMAGLIAIGADGFSAGRVLSLLSMTAIAILVVASGWRRTGWVALLVGAWLVLHPLQWPWSLVIRPDLMAAALSMAAVVVSSDLRARWAVPASAILCTTALLCKQTSVAAPAAILLVLVWRERRQAVSFASILAVTCAASLGALQWASDGRFLFSTVLANVNPFSWDRALAMAHRFLALDPSVVLLIAVLGLLATRRRRATVVTIYAVIALAASLASGKVGSSLNYFIEPLGAIALWAAHELPVAWFDLRRPSRAAIAVLLVTTVTLSSVASGLDQLRNHRSSLASLPLHRRLVEVVASVDGPVISDDASLLVGAGKSVYFRPFIMTQLAEAGLWDQTPLVEQLRHRRIAMIIFRSAPERLHHSRYTAEMRRAMDESYRVRFTYVLGAPFTALVPISDEPPRRPAPQPGSPEGRGEVQSWPEGG